MGAAPPDANSAGAILPSPDAVPPNANAAGAARPAAGNETHSKTPNAGTMHAKTRNSCLVCIELLIKILCLGPFLYVPASTLLLSLQIQYFVNAWPPFGINKL